MADTACWVLTNGVDDYRDEEGGAPHFPSEDRATEYVTWSGSEALIELKSRQLGYVCVTVSCTCCEVVYDEEEEGVVHFDDMPKAEKFLTQCGWKLTREQTLCEYCKVGPCDPERGDHG